MNFVNHEYWTGALEPRIASYTYSKNQVQGGKLKIMLLLKAF